MANPDCHRCGGKGYIDKEHEDLHGERCPQCGSAGPYCHYTVPCPECGDPCSYCGTRGDCIHWQGDGWTKAGADKNNMRGPYSDAAKHAWPHNWSKGYYDPKE